MPNQNLTEDGLQLQRLLITPPEDLTLQDNHVLRYVISELMRKDQLFAGAVRGEIKESLSRGYRPDKIVTLSELKPEELLDIFKPIEHGNQEY